MVFYFHCDNSPLGFVGMKSKTRSLALTFSLDPSIQMYVASTFPLGYSNRVYRANKVLSIRAFGELSNAKPCQSSKENYLNFPSFRGFYNHYNLSNNLAKPQKTFQHPKNCQKSFTKKLDPYLFETLMQLLSIRWKSLSFPTSNFLSLNL